MKSWNVPHSDLKVFCVPFQVELLAGLVPSLDYERTSVVGEFTGSASIVTVLLSPGSNEKEVVRVKEGRTGLPPASSSCSCVKKASAWPPLRNVTSM